MQDMNRMTINLNYSFDLMSAFIIGLIIGLLLRQCEPEPRQEARSAVPEGHEEITFTHAMSPDFLSDEEPESILGVADYIAMREAEKAAEGVAWRLYNMRGKTPSRAIRLTGIFVDKAMKGHAFEQFQIEILVRAYSELFMVIVNAKKHNMDMVDFIDMVLVKLAEIAMRGAA
jgi:hypothetical protein